MRRLVVILVLITLGAVIYGQRWQRRGYGGTYRQAAPPQVDGDLSWKVDERFKSDVFTFVRLRYHSTWGRRGGWATDYPDSDINFSFRLQQLTALKVNPTPIILDITSPELFDYPWCYMIEPGSLEFSEEEVATLRRYLLSGGFLMVDDFWGEREYQNFYEQIKRVFPEREPQELPIEHAIFNCVFPIKAKPQIPNIGLGMESQYTGRTWETYEEEPAHYKGIFDDKGRMMVVICHNTDLGDGWEREGESEYYFREFSEKSAYPLGINIIFYAMSH